MTNNSLPKNHPKIHKKTGVLIVNLGTLTAMIIFQSEDTLKSSYPTEE